MSQNFDFNASYINIAKELTGSINNIIMDRFKENSRGFYNEQNQLIFMEKGKSLPIDKNLACIYLPNGRLIEASYNKGFNYYAFDSQKNLIFTCNKNGTCTTIRKRKILY